MNEEIRVHKVKLKGVMLWHDKHGRIPAPIRIFSLSLTSDKVREVKRRLLEILLKYPDPIPLNCSFETTKYLYSVDKLLYFCKQETDIATASTDQLLIKKADLKDILKEIESYKGILW